MRSILVILFVYSVTATSYRDKCDSDISRFEADLKSLKQQEDDIVWTRVEQRALQRETETRIELYLRFVQEVENQYDWKRAPIGIPDEDTITTLQSGLRGKLMSIQKHSAELDDAIKIIVEWTRSCLAEHGPIVTMQVLKGLVRIEGAEKMNQTSHLARLLSLIHI